MLLHKLRQGASVIGSEAMPQTVALGGHGNSLIQIALLKKKRYFSKIANEYEAPYLGDHFF